MSNSTIHFFVNLHCMFITNKAKKKEGQHFKMLWKRENGNNWKRRKEDKKALQLGCMDNR